MWSRWSLTLLTSSNSRVTHTPSSSSSELLCGADVSYKAHRLNLGLRFLPWQFSLRQVVLDVIQPPPLWSSPPSFPRHLHRHHSVAHIFFFSFQYIPLPLQPTFQHFLGYFSHLRCPSNSIIPNSVQVGDSSLLSSILTSSFPPE